MNKEKKYCRFVSVSYLLGCYDSFYIEDGGSIFINGKEIEITYIDAYHFLVGYHCYHIEEFFEKVVKLAGNIVVAGKGVKLEEKGNNYCPYEANSYPVVTISGFGNREFQFSKKRIMRESLPLGIYSYDIKYDKENNDNASEIAEYVSDDAYLGTILSNKPLMRQDEVINLNRMNYNEPRRISA